MRFAICDDNRSDCNMFEAYLLERDIETEIYEDGDSLIYAYEKNSYRYDAVFLDIEMPGKNGLEVADTIRKMDAWVPIIFVTVHTKYMQESFKCSPFRFLVKPLEMEELAEAVKSLFIKIDQERKTILVKEGNDLLRLYCDDIVFCESDGHHVIIHTQEECFHVRQSIKDLENLVDPTSFQRVHRSYLVNMNYVKRIKENRLILQHDNGEIPVGRVYKKELVRALMHFEERRLQL